MKKVIVPLVLCFFLATAGFAVQWPLDIEIDASASFAEFRGFRFHAGIDLRTQRRNGLPVRAMADGYVSRIKIQFRGYGYALYLDHPELQVRSVYAHLQDFASPVADVAREKLEKMKARHGIDEFFPAGRFPVKKGQIIAYSGESGIGPSHLHFEVRKLNDDPILPTTLGLTLPDKHPPQILAVSFDPLAADTRLNDGFLPVTVTPRKGADGKLSWTAPPVIEGRTGIQVGLVDRNDNGNVFGVHSVEVRLDGKPLFRRVFERFSYDEMDQSPWVYDDVRSRLPGRGYVVTMFRWPWETTPFGAGFGPWSGCLTEEHAGRRHLEIEIVDFGGRRVTAAGPIVVTPPGKQPLQGEPLGQSLGKVRETHVMPFAVVLAGSLERSLGDTELRSIGVRDGQGKEHSLPAMVRHRRWEVAIPVKPAWMGGAWVGETQLLASGSYIEPAKGGTIGPIMGASLEINAKALVLPSFARLEAGQGGSGRWALG
jgi:hypothetical protein